MTYFRYQFWIDQISEILITWGLALRDLSYHLHLIYLTIRLKRR